MPSSSSSYKNARDKIASIHREIDEANLKIVKRNQKKSRVLFWTFIFFIVSVTFGLVFSIFSGAITFFIDETPSEIKLVKAQADEFGQIDIFLELNSKQQGKRPPVFQDVKAHLLEVKSGKEYVAEVMPVYLEKNNIQMLIRNPGLVTLPGTCKIIVYLKGKYNTSNNVTIEYLETKSGETGRN